MSFEIDLQTRIYLNKVNAQLNKKMNIYRSKIRKDFLNTKKTNVGNADFLRGIMFGCKITTSYLAQCIRDETVKLPKSYGKKK